MSKYKSLVSELTSLADININGDRPWDIQVNDERFYQRALKENSLGIGESYMDGWWNCEAIDQLIHKVMDAGLEHKVRKSFKLVLKLLAAKFLNFQTIKRAKIVGEKHYDVGNDLFQKMLDKRMNYTCGYWKHADNLDDAQEAKLKLTCDKIHLKPGMKVLDIGCGWGGFAKYAAENYGANVVGVTISKEQLKLGQKRCAGLPVDLRFQDYREVTEQFDRIVSLGMFEHVGMKNYATYMKVVHRCLHDDGLFLLHTIGSNHNKVNADPWISKYIFPNSMLPSICQIAKAISGLFIMEDWHNFGADYDKTLMAWHQNFVGAWESLKDQYSDRFFRMWSYYLLICAGLFRAREAQLWQIVLSKSGVANGYQAAR